MCVNLHCCQTIQPLTSKTFTHSKITMQDKPHPSQGLGTNSVLVIVEFKTQNNSSTLVITVSFPISCSPWWCQKLTSGMDLRESRPSCRLPMFLVTMINWDSHQELFWVSLSLATGLSEEVRTRTHTKTGGEQRQRGSVSEVHKEQETCE